MSEATVFININNKQYECTLWFSFECVDHCCGCLNESFDFDSLFIEGEDFSSLLWLDEVRKDITGQIKDLKESGDL